MKKHKSQIVPIESISQKIFLIRGTKVMLAKHIAEIYGVSPSALIQAVKRNTDRFPEDFMFQLTKDEFKNLKSQFVTSSWGGVRRALPYAFTEHGVSMLSSILKGPRAVQMSVFIIRAFIKLREMLATNQELAHRIEKLEKEQLKQGEHISVIHDILKRLITGPSPSKKRIGFKGE